MNANHTFYEFFAGGGMARAGLGNKWQCLFANDFSEMKAHTYKANWGDGHFVPGDVGKVTTAQLKGRADLAWASFPCQDLSLAGKYGGLGDADSEIQTRSGTFWPFWKIIKKLSLEGRAPKTIVLENVTGAITSRSGSDFNLLCDALAEARYKFGAIVVDAKHFVPQSRPRLFFVAVAEDIETQSGLKSEFHDNFWHPQALRAAQSRLSLKSKSQWIWWSLTRPEIRNINFVDLIEEIPTKCQWHTEDETRRLLSMMTPLHLSKIEQAKASGVRQVGAIYKRTRPDAQGIKRQRAEVRFDNVAGCLRTPAGGSSRQIIILVDGPTIQTRLLSPREAARLMGLDDSYRLPETYNDGYHVAGDGVCVAVVRYLASNLLEPILCNANGHAMVKAA